jgi:hypothetical protein
VERRQRGLANLRLVEHLGAVSRWVKCLDILSLLAHADGAPLESWYAQAGATPPTCRSADDGLDHAGVGLGGLAEAAVAQDQAGAL